MPEIDDMLLYTAAQVRELDRRAIEDAGIAGYELMCRAGVALCEQVNKEWPDAGQVCVLCGPGNNGGDGYVVARLLREAGRTVGVLALTDPGALRGAARQAADDYRAGGGDADDRRRVGEGGVEGLPRLRGGARRGPETDRRPVADGGVGIGQQVLYGPGHCLFVIRRQQYTVHPIADQVGHSTYIGRDYWQPESHGLDHTYRHVVEVGGVEQ